jgi:chromosome segregation ATPase
MSSLKQIRLAQKLAGKQGQVVQQLNSLVKDIERCERTIVELKIELESVNKKHQGRRTTRDDIAYLTDLLACANKKLTWEKHMASLQKRTPQILEELNKVRNDPKNPPTEESNAQLLQALQAVQGAMERLQTVKPQ